MNRRSLFRAALAAPLGVAAASTALAAGDDVADRFAKTLTDHDIDAFAALFADGYVNHQTSAAAPPPPAGMRPKDATVAFFKGRLAGLPDLRVSIEARVASGDRVAASFVYEGTQTAPYLGVAPTGRKLRFTSCDIFRVENGKIAEHWGMGDIAGVLAQLKG